MPTLREELVVIFTIIAIILSFMNYKGFAFVIFATVAGYTAGGIIGKFIYHVKRRN